MLCVVLKNCFMTTIQDVDVSLTGVETIVMIVQKVLALAPLLVARLCIFYDYHLCTRDYFLSLSEIMGGRLH